MNSTSTQFVSSRRMGMYDHIHQMGMWDENFKPNGNPIAPAALIVPVHANLDNQVRLLAFPISMNPVAVIRAARYRCRV